ncbi:hypothetical protein ACFSSC_11015 [Corynebacterium mendelii]|uniref:Uncharacterized protein n=1 Tax=Corynebacterium mendelii TaxID=2765362 RepID=A0A939E2H4_9CORY|nr:hypothetical protein [Corynebacterium mendelii]MBN9644491.1 hypothetical protein [Corynebacterium mendelii]
MSPTKKHHDSQRQQLVRDSVVGFVGFFAFLSVVQAVINVLRPEPLVWPALLALVMVILFVVVYRITRPGRRG